MWQTLLERKVTVLGVTSIFAAVAGLYAMQATPQYQSVAVLQLEIPEDLLGQQDAAHPTTLLDSAAKRHLHAQLTLLKSRRLSELVVDEMGLGCSPLPPSPKAAVEATPVALTLQASDPEDPPLRLQLTREWPLHLAQRGHRNDGVLHLPDDDVLIAREKAIRMLRTALTIAPVPESRLVEVRVLAPDPAQAACFANAIAQNFIKIQRMREDQTQRRRPQGMQPVFPSDERSHVNSLNTGVPDLSDASPSDSPRARLDARLEAEMQALVAGALQWHSPEMQETEKAVDSRPSESTDLVEASNAEHLRELLGAFADTQPEHALAQDTRASHAAIVEEATPPRTPDTPSPLTLLGLALVLGLITGALTALHQDKTDGATPTSDPAQAGQDFSLLGAIPTTPMPTWANGMAVVQLVHTEPNGTLVEAYKRIGQALLSRQPQDAPNTWLVTSHGHGEGKTTTAVALAIVWAQMGQKVLLIDADLRHPGVHQALQLPNTEGLSLLLRNPAHAPLPLQATLTENLSVITAGPLTPDPLGLLVGAGLRSLLDDAGRLGFDCVVIDGPSLQGLADAMVMANLVKQVVLVVKETAAQKTPLQASVEDLKTAGAGSVQVVLTQVRQA